MQSDFMLPPRAYEQNQSVFSQIHREYLQEVFYKRESSIDNKSQNLQRISEQVFLTYISTGNIAMVDKMVTDANDNGMIFPSGTMSSHPLNQARYVLVSSIAIFCRAAIDGGLPEHISYTISDCYIQQLDKTTNIADIYALFLGVLYEYTHAVYDYRIPLCSPPVHLCLEYISTHLHTAISLADLSNVCGLSVNYISDLFYKELAVRPIAYIRSEKLKYAGFLLRDSNAPVAEISTLLAFPSPSAFSSQFQKQYGMSPSAYRNAGTI